MPQRNKIKYTPIAVNDTDEIFSYITQDSVIAAEALLDKIAGGIAKLAEFPNMGSVLPEDEYPLVTHGYRFIVVNPYLVFYRIIDSTIIINRILHGRRDYLRDLFITIE